MRLRALFIASALAATMAATALAPQVASAAHETSNSAIKWVCQYIGGQQDSGMSIAAPGIGKTFEMGTGYGPGGGNGTEYGGVTTGREQSLTSLTLVSVTQLTPGWTAVINKAGPPKVVVQFTNTGGGGLPPNTLRLRSFFTIAPYHGNTSNYVITENVATCVPAS